MLIFGPGAVGKMTVGMKLSEKTGIKLFTNHDSLELPNRFFPFGSDQLRRLSEMIRFEFFKEIASSDLPGLIFTFVWAFDLSKEEEYVDRIVNIFAEAAAEIYYVELEASLETRLTRNTTELRLSAKPSKRNVENSESVLRKNTDKHRLNTYAGEFTRANYLKIVNDNLSADEVADIIIEHFNFPLEE